MTNSFLADTQAKNEDEVMYFLVGAIVSTIVLVGSKLFNEHFFKRMVTFVFTRDSEFSDILLSFCISRQSLSEWLAPSIVNVLITRPRHTF